MTMWKVEIKYTKIAIPDTILFSNKQVAEYYLETKKDNPNVRWMKLHNESVEVKA